MVELNFKGKAFVQNHHFTVPVHELMDDYGLNTQEAMHVKGIMDEEGLDAEEAVELKDGL